MVTGARRRVPVVGRAALADGARRAAGVAFAALVVLSPFRARIELAARPSPPVYGDFTDILLFWSDVALVATLGLWVVALAAGRRRPSIGPPFLAWPIGVLLAVAALGIPFAVDPVLAAYGELRLVALASLALYVLDAVERLDELVGPVAVMVVVQAIVAIGQVVSQRSLGLAALGEHDLSPAIGVSVVTALDGTRLLRGYGLADHPNIVGGLLAFGLLIVGVGVAHRERRAIHAVVFALGTLAILLTFSRSALLGLAVGLVVAVAMLAWRRDRAAVRGWLLAVAGAALVCAPFVAPYLPWVVARSEAVGPIATEQRSLDERGALADAANEVFIGHVLLGAGLGGLPLAIRAGDPAFPYPYQPAHVVLLDVAAETGVVGAACYLLLLVAPWLALVRRPERWTRDLAVASGALAAVTVVGLFDYYTWTYPAGRLWAWIVLGLWARSYRASVADGGRA